MISYKDVTVAATTLYVCAHGYNFVKMSIRPFGLAGGRIFLHPIQQCREYLKKNMLVEEVHNVLEVILLNHDDTSRLR